MLNLKVQFSDQNLSNQKDYDQIMSRWKEKENQVAKIIWESYIQQDIDENPEEAKVSFKLPEQGSISINNNKGSLNSITFQVDKMNEDYTINNINSIELIVGKEKETIRIVSQQKRCISSFEYS